MNKKTTLICSFIFVFLVLSTSAVALTSPIIVDSEIVQDRIKSNETAKFLMLVENIRDQEDVIKIHHDFLRWQVLPEPYLLRIPAGSRRVSEIRVSPPSNIAPGAYSLTLKLHSQNYPEIVRKHTLVVYVTENIDKNVLNVDSEIPNASYPGNMNFTLKVKNVKDYLIQNVLVELDSEIFSERKGYFFENLLALENKIIEDDIFLLSKSPGDYSILINGYVDDELLFTDEVIFNLKERGGVTLSRTIESNFLSKTHIINIVNEGNLKASKQIKANFGSFERFFISSDPEPSATTAAERGEDWFWGYSLESGESTVITYTVNYRILFYISVILGLFVFIYYFYFFNQIKISKQIILTKTKDNKKYIKIMLHLKNNSNKGVHNIKLIDWIKNPLNLIEQFDTLHPSIIKKKEDRIKIKWNISTLAPKEEKVVSYGTKAKMEILGELSLPKAAVLIKKGDKLKEIWSNSPILKGKE